MASLLPSARFRWFVGPVEYQVIESLSHDHDARMRWMFISRNKEGGIQRYVLRYSGKTRRFTVGQHGKSARMENQRAEELERLYFPHGAPLRPPEGSLSTIMRNMITDKDLATATALSLTGKLP